MLINNTNVNHGDQRRIYIQLHVVNKRRKKRTGKKRKTSKLPLEYRVIHILDNGAIADYTHPKEVDPFWDKLYRQFEFLCYVDIAYRNTLKNYDDYINEEELESIIRDLTIIREYKLLIMANMMNFMTVMYGSVIQSRFYGWKYYIDDFVSKFNEVAVTNLKKLRFNPEQTRCSVYFYQAFWLSGLSIIGKISAKFKQQYNDDSSLNRGSILFSSEDKTFEEILEEGDSESLDSIRKSIMIRENSLDDEIKDVAENKSEKEIKKEEDEINKDLLEKQKEKELRAIDYEITPEQQWERKEENQQDLKLHYVLKRLLDKINVPIDYLYKTTDKGINKLAKIIRQKISNGQISLNSKEKELLSEIFTKKIK